MSKLFKKIKKGVSKLWKGVKKVFKKITSSKLGKVLLAAAAIYVGGVMLGSWGGSGPLSFLSPAGSGAATATTAVPGATVGGTTAGATGTNVTIGAGGAIAETGAVTGATVGGTQGATIAGGAGGAVTGATGATGVSSVGTGVIGAAETAAATGGTVGGVSSISAPLVSAEGLSLGSGLSSATIGGNVVAGAPQTLFQSIVSGAKSVGGWANRNPFAASMAMSGVAKALAKDPSEEQYKYRQKLLGESFDNDKLREISIFGRTGDRAPIFEYSSGSMLG